MSTRHQTADCPFPPLTDGLVRVYANLHCPFSERARLLLAYKNIPHEVIYISFNSKPSWFLERNPNGSTPVLQNGDKIVYDSQIVCDYIDDAFPENRLTPEDPFEKAQQRMMVDDFCKVHAQWHKFVDNNKDDMEKAKILLPQLLEKFEKKLNSTYFGGSSPGMTDFKLWPWFERFGWVKILFEFDILPPAQFPKLSAWKQTMLDLPAVKACCVPDEKQAEFIKSIHTGAPDFDIGM